jgi:hypothetical protein
MLAVDLALRSASSKVAAPFLRPGRFNGSHVLDLKQAFERF